MFEKYELLLIAVIRSWLVAQRKTFSGLPIMLPTRQVQSFQNGRTSFGKATTHILEGVLDVTEYRTVWKIFKQEAGSKEVLAKDTFTKAPFSKFYILFKSKSS